LYENRLYDLLFVSCGMLAARKYEICNLSAYGRIQFAIKEDFAVRGVVEMHVYDERELFGMLFHNIAESLLR
jgi:hypothetical protein